MAGSIYEDEHKTSTTPSPRAVDVDSTNVHQQSDASAYDDVDGSGSRGGRFRRFLDGFKRDPLANVSKTTQVGSDGKEFDLEGATAATAASPLQRRLKGRHLQMIAIGGSIGGY